MNKSLPLYFIDDSSTLFAKKKKHRKEAMTEFLISRGPLMGGLDLFWGNTLNYTIKRPFTTSFIRKLLRNVSFDACSPQTHGTIFTYLLEEEN